MKNIALINACTDLGVHVNGASLGAQILTKDLSSSFISHQYTITNDQIKKETKPKTPINTHHEINDFVQEFNSLLLAMHELHFEIGRAHV